MAGHQPPHPPPFLSTPSARRATPGRVQCGRAGDISIHALREEGDAEYRMKPNRISDFYPRPPRGGRRGVNREQNLQD